MKFSGIIDKSYLFTLSIYMLASMLVVPEGIIYILVALLFIYLLYYVRFLDISKNSYFRWISLFALFTIVSVVWSINKILSLWAIFHMLLCVIPAFSVYGFIRDEKNIYSVLSVFIYITLLFSAYMIYNYDITSLGEERFGSDIDAGLNGNVLAQYLLYSMISGFVFLYKENVSFLYKCLIIMLVAIMLVFMLMTGCRKTLLMIVAIPFLYLYLKSNKKFVTFIVMMSISLFALFCLFKIPLLYDIIGGRMEELLGMVIAGDEAEGDVSRFLLYKFGFERFAEKPILGYGINTFRVMSDNTYMFWGKNWYAHSNLVELLVDVGVIGTVMYFSWYYQTIKRNNEFINIMERLNKEDKKGVFLNTIISTYLVFELFAVTYYSWFSHIFIALLYAIVKMNHRNILNLYHESCKNGIMENEHMSSYI